MPVDLHQSSRIFHGTGVSAGLCQGDAYRLTRHSLDQLPVKSITAEDIPAETQRLDEAIARSIQQLQAIQKAVDSTIGKEQADLFDSYVMILEDPSFAESIVTHISQELIAAEAACAKAVHEFCAAFGKSSTEYLRERTNDIRELGDRVIRNLLGEMVELDMNAIPVGSILVAEELSPAETARLDTRRIRAFVTANGSRTSHTAILARALNIPAIVAVQEPLDSIQTGTPLTLDAALGEIVAYPTDEMYRTFNEKRMAEEVLKNQLLAENDLPAETLDGYQARLVANVELPTEAMSVRQRYNVGIGLFRTEFLFINGMKLTDEDAQFKAYRDTVTAIKPHSVIFRTLDIGGDKFISQISLPHELNPFLGMRAIRFSLSQPEYFKIQLRAILRASAYGKVRIMFPMISAYEELEQAIKYLDDVKLELNHAKIPFNDDLDVGCMIEVPSAALLADKLIKHLTFFSLGTNDLIQYSMAVDRSNPGITHLYQPAHPSVIRMIKDVTDVAYANGRWVSICGEMAGECLYTPLILGCGIHELSMSPVTLSRVRMLIRSIRMYEAEDLVSYALTCKRTSDVVDACREFVRKACPELGL